MWFGFIPTFIRIPDISQVGAPKMISHIVSMLKIEPRASFWQDNPSSTRPPHCPFRKYFTPIKVSEFGLSALFTVFQWYAPWCRYHFWESHEHCMVLTDLETKSGLTRIRAHNYMFLASPETQICTANWPTTRPSRPPHQSMTYIHVSMYMYIYVPTPIKFI